ncbi:MAG: hypothetical protein U1F66_05020 [bacterium]
MEKSTLQARTKAYGTETSYPTVQHYEESYGPSYEEQVEGYGDSYHQESSEYLGDTRETNDDPMGEEDYSDLDSEFDGWEGEDESVQGSDLKDLKGLIQASDLAWEEKKPLLDSLMKAAAALDLGKAEEALDLYLEAKDEFEGNNEELQAEEQDQKSAFVDKLKEVEAELDKASIPAVKKDRMRDKLKSLDLRSSIDGLSLEKLSGELDMVSQEIEKAKAKAEVASWFKGFSARIPQSSDEGPYTARLGDALQKAMESGSQEDWENFKRTLDQIFQDNLELAKDFKERVVAQLIGTLFYSVAGMDETKLERILDAIPRDVREKMIQVCLTPEYADSLYHCDGDAEKQQYFYYGTGRVVASRLQQSLTEEDSIPATPAPGSQEMAAG